jgi:hypothetical protein
MKPRNCGRMNPVGVSHFAAGQVLQPLVAVEAAPVLADLGKPGTDPVDRRRDRHRLGDLDARLRNQLIARQRPLGLRGRRSTAPHPRLGDELVAAGRDRATSHNGPSDGGAKRPEGRRPGGDRSGRDENLAAGSDESGAQEKDRSHPPPAGLQAWP